MNKDLFDPSDNLSGQALTPGGTPVYEGIDTTAYADVPKGSQPMPSRQGVLSLVALATSRVVVDRVPVDYALVDSDAESGGPVAWEIRRTQLALSTAVKDFRLVYRDFEGKHPDLSPQYRVDVGLQYIEAHPEVEKITDPGVRAAIYSAFATQNVDFGQIELEAYLPKIVS